MDIKLANKVRLAKYIKETNGIAVNPHALFDIQVKRIHEYKRQQMNIFGVIYRYLQIKEMSLEERKNLVPRAFIFGGKAAPGYWMVRSRDEYLMTTANMIRPKRLSSSSTELAMWSTMIRTLVTS